MDVVEAMTDAGILLGIPRAVATSIVEQSSSSAAGGEGGQPPAQP